MARVKVGGKSVPVVAIPGMRGEYIAAPILADLLFIIKKYKVKVTDGFATSGHSAGGEHPAGLAVDLIPDFARGGTWADVDRLAHDAGWKPNAPSPGKGPFRWIGWNTEANHGSGNHLHLSWHGKGSDPLKTWLDKEDKSFGDLLGDAGFRALNRTVGTFIPGGVAAFDVAGDVISDRADDVGQALVSLLFDAIGERGARILLYIGLVGSGTALAVVGVARMAGVRTPVPKLGGATT